MRYFFDTEFIEDGERIDLLSIGIVAEDDSSLYLCNRDAKLDRADEWVIANVYPHLQVGHVMQSARVTTDGVLAENKSWQWLDGAVIAISRTAIRDCILEFTEHDPHPEFWAYYADYDWVVFCQLFGRMVDLPKNYPMWCRDVKQYAEFLGNPKLPEQKTDEHHALNDAEWTRDAYQFLERLHIEKTVK